jgi:hypothetical protein
VPHHDDPTDRVSDPVEIHDAPPDIRPQSDVGDVAEEHGYASAVVPDDDLFEVPDRLRIAAAANHVLGPAELDESPTHVVVSMPDGVDDLLERDLPDEKSVGVHVDLVLLLESPDRRNLGDAGDALEPVPQIPILERSKLRKIVPAGAVDESVLIDPANARRIGPSSVRTPSGKRGRILLRYSSVRLRAQ